MPLLPKVQEFIDTINSRQNSSTQQEITPLNNREASDLTGHKFLTHIEENIDITDSVIMDKKYPISVRIYKPKNTGPLPVLLYFHGGGFVSGNVAQFDPILRQIAKYTNYIVVGVEYRLAPEFPYPQSMLDAKTTIAGIFDVLDKHNIFYANKNIAISGDSAGGGICTLVTQDRDFVIDHKITNQVLFYPVTDYTLNFNSFKELSHGYFLTKERIEWYFGEFFQNNENFHDVSPLFKEFYAEMPNTLVFTAEFDPIKDGGYLYYNKIKPIVSKAQFHEVKGVIHAFLTLEALNEDECIDAYKKMGQFLNAK